MKEIEELFKEMMSARPDELIYASTAAKMVEIVQDRLPRILEAERADWLRSEIERLENERIWKEDGIVITSDNRWNQALTSIITRYKEELSELDKTNGF